MGTTNFRRDDCFLTSRLRSPQSCGRVLERLTRGELCAMSWGSALHAQQLGDSQLPVGTPFVFPLLGARTAAVVALLLSLVTHNTRRREEDTDRKAAVEEVDVTGAVQLLQLRRARPGRVPHPFVVLNITCWTPRVERPAGVVVFVHGLNGHSAFADSAALASHLCGGHNYAVYGLDVEGHGRSGGVRGLVPNLHRHCAADIVAALFTAQRDNPGSPLFLVGISMGGCAALHAALALQDAGLESCLTGGVALLCPLLRPVRMPARTLATAAQVLATLPVLARLPLPAQHRAGDGCSDEAGKAAMRNAMCADGHIHTGGLRVGTAVALLAAARLARRRMHELAGVPLLVQHGTADAVVSLTGSEELYAAAKVDDTTLLTYPGTGHALLSECPAAVGDLTAWMARRCRAHDV